MNFKLNDKVKLTTSTYGDSERNPIWGGRYGEIVGEVIEIEDEGQQTSGHPIRVRWGNGDSNVYNAQDLSLISPRSGKPELPDKFILKYDLDRDPVEFFKTLPEAKKRLAEVMAMRDYRKGSARLFEIKKEFKISTKLVVR